MGNHSSLYQEHAYLLSAIATEQSRGEQFAFSLDATRKRLAAAEHAEKSVAAQKNSRKAVASLRRKLKRSIKSQNAMINNFAVVTSRMQMLEEYQWRELQHDYSQQTQHPLMDTMTANMQHLALVSHMTSGYPYATQTPAGSFSPSVISPLQLSPISSAQFDADHDQLWGLPLYAPFQEQQFLTSQVMDQEWLQVMNPPVPEAGAWWPDDEEASVYSYRASKSRRLSLPVIQRRKVWASTGASAGEEEDGDTSPKRDFHLVRRFSLLGAASTGMRLQRFVE